MRTFFTFAINRRFALTMGLLATAISFSACGPSKIYESFEDLERGNWPYEKATTFPFVIEDEAQGYDIAYMVRNAGAYPFYNLYIKYTLTDTRGEIIKGGIHEVNLMDPKTGRPLGKSVGDLYTHQVPLLTDFSFPAKGEYELQIKQYMRLDVLPGIFAVGVSIQLNSQE